MDIFYGSLLSLLVIVISCSLCFAFYKPAADGKLPPGGRGWPVIGETIEFVTTGLKGHPEKFILDRMTKFSHHVFRTSLILQDVVVFCGQEGNKFLFTNENKLVLQWLPPSVGKILPFSEHNRTKAKMVRKYFKPEALRQYVPVMDMVTQKHFQTGWEGKDQIMTQKLIKNFTFTLACKIFFSIDDPEWANNLSAPFEKLAPGIFSIPINLPGTPLRRAINAATFIRKELTTIVNRRKIDLADGKASPTQDILSLFLCDDEAKSMAEIEVADLMVGLLIGGQDSTSSTCAIIVNYLAELPEIYEGVYRGAIHLFWENPSHIKDWKSQESPPFPDTYFFTSKSTFFQEESTFSGKISHMCFRQEQIEITKSKASKELLNWEDLSKMRYSWNVACEVLRLVPPTQGTFREAITDFTYNGYSIPKGWKLYWSTNSTHKNPNFFPEPEMFNPSRFDNKRPTPYTFVPFGGGGHQCPGKDFVRVEILVFMHHLVTKFKLEKLIPNEQIIFNPVPKLEKGLPIRLYPHKP